MTVWNDPGNDVDALSRLFARMEKAMDPMTALSGAIVDRRVDRAVAALLAQFEVSEADAAKVGQSIRADLFQLIEGLNQARAAAGALAGAFRDDVAEPVREGRKQIQRAAAGSGLAVNG